MTQDSFVECSFFIPIRRDVNLSDGKLHVTKQWKWLEGELFARFGGGTTAPGLYRGFYRDPDTNERISDESHRYIVAISSQLLDELRGLLAEACVMFQQKCIYLSIAGEVEFIEADHDNPTS